MSTTTEHLIVSPAPAKLMTANAQRRAHFHVQAEIVRQWRWATRVLAMDGQVPAFATVEVDAYPLQGPGAKLADAGAHAPVVKACVDGLVDAGVIADDSPTYVYAIRHHAPSRAKVDGMRLELAGTLAELSASRPPTPAPSPGATPGAC